MVRKKAEGVWHTLSTDDYTLTMSVKYTSGSWSHMTQVLFLQASSTNVQVYYQVHNGWQVFRLWISFNITYPLATTSLINLSQTSCFSEWLKCWPVPQRSFSLSRPKTLAVEVKWGWMVEWLNGVESNLIYYCFHYQWVARSKTMSRQSMGTLCF